MEFKNNLTKFFDNEETVLNINNTYLPTTAQVYYKSKRNEVLNQYETARMFLRETELNDSDHWFKKSDDETENLYYNLVFKSIFYETSLIYYNMVVDLTWSLFYVSVEFMVNKEGNSTLIPPYQPVTDAYDIIRKLERIVTNPSDESAPYGYFARLNKTLKPIFDHIQNFWNTISESTIRKNYNYIKHQGKPNYSEIKDLNPSKMFAILVQNKEIPSSIEDVQKEISLTSSIEDLIDFDDNMLFPYIERLISLLDSYVKPSKLIQ